MPKGALEGPRRLMLEVPHYQGDYATGVFPDSLHWSNYGLTNAIMFEGSLDLSGYELDKLTFVPQGSELQDPGRYIYDVGPAGYPIVDVEVLDIISQERLSLTAIDAALTLGNVPGMLGTTEDFSQIIMGNYRVMVVPNTTGTGISLLVPQTGGTFGSGEATAASRLWLYRVVRINGAKGASDILKIPASRFLLVGTVVDEEELPYMMRLKRSFELATQG